MDTVLAERAQFILDKLSTIPETSRLLVAIAGVPASGKSTFASRLVHKLNANNSVQAILVGLDGWHLTRAQLDTMPDPKHARDRRGIHWTFDAPSYVQFVASLREPIQRDALPIYAPSFDHALKDPTPNAIAIHPPHRIVLIEGLYTILDIDPWRRAASQMDERWWIEIDLTQARTRLVLRHLQTGVAKDVDEAIWRAENNDEDNGRFISQNLFDVTYTIRSVDDPTHPT